ncbi:MAG: 3-isopropylmalate dehydratase [Theionarchaea archaeon]|nr:3-isopropylmalate dehydratase [Theionarchaea archaeon]
MIISAPALIMGNDIDTDTIIPTYALQLSRDPTVFGEYAFHHTIPDFKERGEKILAAGTNFGCGSSREEAVFALMHAEVKAILAPSFAPIFRRNAFNNALPCIEMDTSPITDGDCLEIDFEVHTVFNSTQHTTFSFSLTPPEETLLTKGGLLSLLRERLT